jgi:hypothetical protein
MTAPTAVSEETGAVPSQVGVQPPPLGARMKASSKAFCPVASMTAPRSGGVLSSGMTYGADPYQLPVRVAAAAGEPMLSAAIAPPAATVAAAASSANVPRRRWMFWCIGGFPLVYRAWGMWGNIQETFLLVTYSS